MWDFGILTACYLYNRNPTRILHGKSPLEALFQRSPEYSKLRVFGCKCFPCLCPYRTNKLDVKSSPCIFVGYSVDQDAYLCLEPSNHRIFASRDVTFAEEDFSLNSSFSKGSAYKQKLQSGQITTKDFRLASSKVIELQDSINESDTVNIDLPPVASEILVPDSDSNEDTLIDTQTSNGDSLAILGSLADELPTIELIESDVPREELPILPRRVTRASHDIVKQNPRYVLTVAATDIPVPRSYKVALSAPKWWSTMEVEIKALHDNSGWKLVPCTLEDNVISTKWVFRVK